MTITDQVTGGSAISSQAAISNGLVLPISSLASQPVPSAVVATQSSQVIQPIALQPETPASATSLTASIDPNSIWSPSSMCGLSTPPPASMAISTEIQSIPSASQQGKCILHPVTLTTSTEIQSIPSASQQCKCILHPVTLTTSRDSVHTFSFTTR